MLQFDESMRHGKLKEKKRKSFHANMLYKHDRLQNSVMKQFECDEMLVYSVYRDIRTPNVYKG